MIKKFMILIMLLVRALSSLAHEEPKPNFIMSYNILQTSVFMLANKLFIDKSLNYVPLHFDAHLRLNNKLALSTAFIYRYEDYADKGPLFSNAHKVRPTQIWTNYHEIFLLVGPRFSLNNTGLEGFYFSARAGLGGAFSRDYHNFSLLMQPEFGYGFVFKNNFSLNLGLGFLVNMPVYENIDFAVAWNKNAYKLNFLGVLVHQVIPVLNLSLGFAI